MFIIEKSNTDNAIRRAKELRPTVIANGTGGYMVSGSQGTDYTVRVRAMHDMHVIDCECKTRDGIACKHGLAAFSLHQILSQQVYVYQ